MNRYIILSAAAALLATACGKKEEDKKADAMDVLPLVEVETVHVAAVDQIHEYTANVEAYKSNNISPAASNRIKTITVDVGDHVRRGQVLVTMDNSEAARLKVNLDQIQREYNRATQLLKIGSGTQAQVDQLKAQLDASRTQYNNVIENTVLRSPVSGVVTARNFDPGDVTAGQPVLTIGQITPDVKIIINVTEADRAKFHAGMPVDVTFDAFPGESYAAKVSRIYPAVDPQTRTFQAEVLIPNNGEKFFPGMFARVSVNHGTQENVVVPDRAVVKQTGSGNRYVYVLRGDKVTFNKVELGTRTDNGYEIISGVADGDTVVVAGQSRLADGVRVQLNTKKK
ncbi:MAG: efflux RND transporter periplasmic adaptor subunit [Muribaculaceae bacterium]